MDLVRLSSLFQEVAQHSRNKALSLLKDAGYSEIEANDTVNTLLDAVPVLNGSLRNLVGVVRWVINGEIDITDATACSRLNAVLFVLQSSPAGDIYDKNFFNELTNRESSYKEIVEVLGLEFDTTENSLETKATDYTIIECKSYEELLPFQKYASDWCVFASEEVFSEYTLNGRNRFLIALRSDYKETKKYPSEGFPMDSYGRSVIGIILDENGGLVSTTFRWNSSYEDEKGLSLADLQDLLKQRL